MTDGMNQIGQTQNVVTHLALLVPGVGPITVDRLDTVTRHPEGKELHVERRDVVLFSRDSAGRLSPLDPADLSQGYAGDGALTVVDDDGTSFVFAAGAWPGLRFTVAEARSLLARGDR